MPVTNAYLLSISHNLLFSTGKNLYAGKKVYLSIITWHTEAIINSLDSQPWHNKLK